MRAALVFLLCMAAVAAAAAEAPGDEGGVALVIGIDGYQALGALETCRNDAREFARALVEFGGYRESRVVLLTDDASQAHNRPTLATMRRRISQVASLARPQETLILYFSGHGITRDGKGYLVPSDGDAENAVALDWIKQQLTASRAASKILILDACHAGSAAKGVSGIAPSMVAEAAGLVMLLSSGADGVSYPLADEKRSVFSKYLVEGLEGKADADADRSVTLTELFSYVEESLTDWSLATGKTQTPVMCPKETPTFVFSRVVDTVAVRYALSPSELPPGYELLADSTVTKVFGLAENPGQIRNCDILSDFHAREGTFAAYGKNDTTMFLIMSFKPSTPDGIGVLHGELMEWGKNEPREVIMVLRSAETAVVVTCSPSALELPLRERKAIYDACSRFTERLILELTLLNTAFYESAATGGNGSFVGASKKGRVPEEIRSVPNVRTSTSLPMAGTWIGDLSEDGSAPPVTVSLELRLAQGEPIGTFNVLSETGQDVGKGASFELVEIAVSGNHVGFTVPISGAIDNDSLEFSLELDGERLAGFVREKREGSDQRSLLFIRKGSTGLASSAWNSEASSAMPITQLRKHQPSEMPEEEWEDIDWNIVSEERYAEYLLNADKYVSQVTVLSHSTENGEPDGLLLAKVSKDSEAYRRGFRQGDVVKRINGTRVTSIQAALRAAKRIQREEEYLVDVVIVRDGVEKTFSYEIWPE